MSAFARFQIVKTTLAAELAKPYQYGVADCFMTGCRVADALDSGLGMAELYAGRYSTLQGAQRALKKRGLASLAELFACHLEPEAPAMALVGDLAIVRLVELGRAVEHVGVCGAGGFVVKTRPSSIIAPLSDAIAAFRVDMR